MTPVSTKLDFYRRLRAGEFRANDNHRWYDVMRWSADRPWLRQDWNVKRTTQLMGVPLHAEYAVLPVWGIQSIAKPGSRCDYNVPTLEVFDRIATWKTPYSISPMLPDDYIVVQGEVWEDIGGLYLNFSTAKIPMRPALKEHGEHRSGLAAKIYLETLLTSEDYEDIIRLLTDYPGHVVEFGVYGCAVGVLKRRMVVWEVRNY